MGRKSEYKYVDLNFKRENLKQVAVKKFLQESMSPRELAAICEEKFPEFTMDEKTVRNNIKKLCDGSEGILKLEDFQNDKGNYSIRPELQAVLMILIVKGTVDGRENDTMFDDVKKRTIEVFNDMESVFSKEDIDYLKEIPFYNNIILEAELVDIITLQFYDFLQILGTVESVSRLDALVKASKEIKKLKEKFYKCNIKEWTDRNFFGTSEPSALTIREDRSDESCVERMLFSSTWREMLFNLLVVKVNHLKYSPEHSSKLNELRNLKELYKETLKKSNRIREQARRIIDEGEFLKKGRDNDRYKKISDLILEGYKCKEQTMHDLCNDLKNFNNC